MTSVEGGRWSTGNQGPVPLRSLLLGRLVRDRKRGVQIYSVRGSPSVLFLHPLSVHLTSSLQEKSVLNPRSRIEPSLRSFFL